MQNSTKNSQNRSVICINIPKQDGTKAITIHIIS